MKKICLSFVFLLFVGNWACTADPEPSLPPITQEGRNTFGCKINGRNWVPGGDLGWGEQALTHDYSPEYEAFDITANSNYDGRFTSVGFGAYWNGKSSDIKEDYVIISLIYRGKMWQHVAIPFETKFTNIKITKLDTLNKIVAGQFHFMFITGKNDTTKVTEGRFDIKYK